MHVAVEMMTAMVALMKTVLMVYVGHMIQALFMISIIVVICSLVVVQVFVMEARLVVSSMIQAHMRGLGIVLVQTVVSTSCVVQVKSDVVIVYSMELRPAMTVQMATQMMAVTIYVR